MGWGPLMRPSRSGSWRPAVSWGGTQVLFDGTLGCGLTQVGPEHGPTVQHAWVSETVSSRTTVIFVLDFRGLASPELLLLNLRPLDGMQPHFYACHHLRPPEASSDLPLGEVIVPTNASDCFHVRLVVPTLSSSSGVCTVEDQCSFSGAISKSAVQNAAMQSAIIVSRLSQVSAVRRT